MKNVYHWSMRNGAPLLYIVSLVLFLIGFGQAVVGLKSTFGEVTVTGASINQGIVQWLMLISGTFAALSSAAIPFIGALVIYRWDRRTGNEA